MVFNAHVPKDEKSYEKWIQKFEQKKTTDDTFTPAPVMTAVNNWVTNHYQVNSQNFVRPFYPGGDYKKEMQRYNDDSIVVDNPPFSILNQIVYDYLENDIKFFLFAPELTLMHVGNKRTKEICRIFIGISIEYSNGASIPTGFITNLDKNIALTAPDLCQAIKKNNGKKKRHLPKYQYPDNLLLNSDMRKIAKAGFHITINDGIQVRQLDSQKPMKKTIFGGGMLISESSKNKILEAKKKIETKKKPIIFKLSDREKDIIQSLE